MPFIVLLLILVTRVGLAADLPNGTWRVSEIAVDLYPCQQAACGKIVWLENPAQRHFCGRVIIWGLMRDGGSSEWNGGWFYNPKDDTTYNLKANVDNNDRITARIYRGITLLGRTEILTRIKSHSLAGWCR